MSRCLGSLQILGGIGDGCWRERRGLRAYLQPRHSCLLRGRDCSRNLRDCKTGQVWKEKKTEVGISLMGTGVGVGGRGVRRWEPGQVYLNWMDTAPGTLPEPRPPLRPGPFQGLLGTIRAAFRTAWTSRPQVSSLASTGREQSEIASGCGRVSSRFTRGGEADLTCKESQSSWKHLSVLCGSQV